MLSHKNTVKPGNSLLLFYKEYEADKFVKYDRYLKRVLRPVYNLLHHRQKKTGFAVSFDLMCRALGRAGYDVRVNDYRRARANPSYPVGLVGFPILLDGWQLSNPAILGPSLYDHPMLAPKLFDDARFKKLAVLAPWTQDIFAPVYGEHRCFKWFAGLDLQEWPDLSLEPKDFDFLIYDKIRWDHDLHAHELIEPITRVLDAKRLSYRIVRYKMHDHTTFRASLTRARNFLFLCEHETQGIAYQEAMATGAPVLAWDPGTLVDPIWKKFSDKPPATSSVPFFAPECGEKFRNMSDFGEALDRFLCNRSSYTPRDFVARELDPEVSAKIYADQYFSLLNG
jgi:hypothetical protein